MSVRALHYARCRVPLRAAVSAVLGGLSELGGRYDCPL